MKLPSEVGGLIDSLSTHITNALSSHINLKRDRYLAALRNVEKLSLYVKKQIEDVDKEVRISISSKSSCDVCYGERKSYSKIPLGHYVHCFICPECWANDELLKAALNKNLPTSMKLKEAPLSEILLKETR